MGDEKDDTVETAEGQSDEKGKVEMMMRMTKRTMAVSAFTRPLNAANSTISCPDVTSTMMKKIP